MLRPPGTYLSRGDDLLPRPEARQARTDAEAVAAEPARTVGGEVLTGDAGR